MVVKGLSHGDSALIGFVVSSLFASAITAEELRRWALYMIERYEVDDLPLYIFDLMDCNNPVRDIYEIIGFVSGWQRTKSEDLALEGIAFARGFNRYERNPLKEICIKKLKENPHVLVKFKETFPFIDVSEVEDKLDAIS